jgi:hypothetical protein
MPLYVGVTGNTLARLAVAAQRVAAASVGVSPNAA